MAVDKKHKGTELIAPPKERGRTKLLDLFGLSKNNDRMKELAFAGRMRRLIAAGMVGAALAQPVLEGCSNTNARPDTPDAGQLPEIDDPAPDEDAAVHRTVDNSVDEEVNILDLDPETGLGATTRSVAQALRMTPQAGNIPVVFFNTTNGWKQCAIVQMPEAQAGNQAWWDNTRRHLDAANCGTIDVERQLPLGMPWRAEHMFTQIRHTARLPMNAHERANRRTQMRRAFLAAAGHTELYRYLNAYSPDLAEQFVNLVCDGIPSVETEYGKEAHRSTTGAEGMWQIQPQTLRDARRLNPTAWQTIFGNHNVNVNNVTDASKVAALVFNNIFTYYRSKWNANHAVFRHPEALLIPALIGAYNHGQGTVERMLEQRLQENDMQAILNSNDDDRIQNEAYMTASTVYFSERRNANYGTASVGYVPKVFAYHALFQGDVPGETNDIIDTNENPSITTARAQARTNLNNLRQRQNRLVASINAEDFNLDNVQIPRNGADWAFVTSASSQNNAVVYPWVVRHDPFAQRYQNGLPTDAALATVIAHEVANGRLVRENTNSHPEIVFDGNNIPQSWRRVMRADHISTYHRLIEEINALMYANGLPSDVMVVPIITSTMRNTGAQRRLRGHSNRSAHPMGAAIDASCRQYAVIRRRTDGSYERFVTDNNISMFFRALVQASAHLARPRHNTDGGVQQGDIFVRFHGPPKHFHMVVRNLATDGEIESEHDSERPNPDVPPQRPNIQSSNRPNVPNGRRRIQLRRPRFRPGVNNRRPVLRRHPVNNRSQIHPPVRRPINPRVINRRGRRR